MTCKSDADPRLLLLPSSSLFSNSVRSFSYNSSTDVPCTGSPTAYFSINGGATNLNQYNNCNNGEDYGDWIYIDGKQVQDAFGPDDQAASGRRGLQLQVCHHCRSGTLFRFRVSDRSGAHTSCVAETRTAQGLTLGFSKGEKSSKSRSGSTRPSAGTLCF